MPLIDHSPTVSTTLYLPIVMSQRTVRRINAPYFNVADVGQSKFEETAIFWFGRVTPTENYADVRVGYNNSELYVYLAAFDRQLWYDTMPSPADLTAWDAATLYLDLDGNSGGVPSANAYRFDAQLNWYEPRTGYQAGYRGTGSNWALVTLPFSTASAYRGVNAPNDGLEKRGWAATFHIPFASLGLSGPPAKGTLWGMAMTLHDRDDLAGTPIADQVWPETLNANAPRTWAQLVFGLPAYSPPSLTPAGTVTVRHKLNGANVPDAAVGGTTGSLCPGDSNYIWNQWGNANFSGAADFNIQNQSDVADWPCFAKYYVTFPTSAIPSGKIIISATLTLHQFGGSGGAGQAQPSLIQVLSVAEDWNEATLNWNNAPIAVENVGQAWAEPLSAFPGWPGALRTWDVSYAVAQAYALGRPLHLALYEADSAYHSGKYFVSSDTGDWNAGGRPTLQVVWGNP